MAKNYTGILGSALRVGDATRNRDIYQYVSTYSRQKSRLCHPNLGQKNIQKRKDSILLLLHRELNVFIHTIEMVVKTGHMQSLLEELYMCHPHIEVGWCVKRCKG